ncbi:MAG: response regulator, partial [Desulfarculaceae bacterium]
MAETVLVVDDDLDLRNYLATVLDSAGLQVQVAENGESGMAKVRQGPPDLVTLDVMMPKESGIKMYRELKADPELSRIPVLIISGLAQKTFLHTQGTLDQKEGADTPPPDGYIE